MHSNNFSFVPYTIEFKQHWDGVVKQSKNGNFLHLRDYMDYHAHRFDEQSIIVERKGRPIAVFPCNRQANTIISHGGLTYGGLIYGNDLHAAEVLEVFSHLRKHYQMLGARHLLYKAIPHIFHRYPAEEDIYALFRLNARLVRRDLSCVVLVEDRIKFTELRTRKIRKAQKCGVELVLDGSLEDFHTLLETVLSKFGSCPVHSPAELVLLSRRFPEKIRLCSAIKDGNLLAAALVYDFGHVAHTQYLASSDEGRELGALDFVLANLLDHVFADRRYFSFGISTEQDGRYLNEGLAFQKEGFGGRAVVHDFYELEMQ